MFEYVVLRRSEGGSPVSAGMIAEALLFYRRVHLVIDRPTLFQLVRQIGFGQLNSLLARSDISAVYTEEILATITNSVGSLKVHDFGAVTLAGNESEGQLKTPEDRLEFELKRTGIKPSEAKSFVKAFLRKVPVRRWSGNHFVQDGIPKAARTDLDDKALVHAAVRKLLSLVPGGHDPGDGLKFDVVGSDLGHYVFDNIDLQRINANRSAMNPPQEALTVAHLLSHIQEARADLALAAHYGGDFVTSSMTSAVVQLRHSVLLQRTQSNAEALQQFVEIAVPDMPTVAEAIDAGERTFPEFLRLLDQATRFKDWVASANPDEGLVREYLRSVTAQDWVQTTKAKGIRYMLTTALDQANPVAGFVAGIADNFLIEKLLGGWKPNHFVENRLAPFLRGS